MVNSTYRLLPCPAAVACIHLRTLNLQPPAVGDVFLAIAVGPDLTDLHAIMTVGVVKNQPANIEVLQAFAISEKAYIAACEGVKSLLEPLGFRKFTGQINILSVLQPGRVTEVKPFYHMGIVLAGGVN